MPAHCSPSGVAEGDCNYRKVSQKNEEITMPNAREPLLKPVPITELRPTQITVGLREVKAKRGAKKAPQKAPNSWANI